MTPDFVLMLAMMALAALVCRLAGYGLMGLVPLTARVEAALRAMPLGVMAGIAALAVARGGLAEALAVAAAAAVAAVTGRDLMAAMFGIAVVAAIRAGQAV
jgi:uncharacterized membrane protein